MRPGRTADSLRRHLVLSIQCMNRGIDIRALVAYARRRHQPGKSTVYDCLLRGRCAMSPAELRKQLRDWCGVDVIDVQSVTPDFRGMGLDVSRSLRCVVLRELQQGEGGPWLACEDPWDEELLHTVSTWVGHHLVPAAVTYTDLLRWIPAASADPPRPDEPFTELEQG